MAKIQREFAVPVNPWIERSPGNDAQVLSVDEETGDFTRLSRMAPGTDTIAQGQQTHACWEEVYIVSGTVLDLGLDEWFAAGMYAVRAPGMPHGPWRAGPEGVLMLEQRYGLTGDSERLPREHYEHP
jgi:hypothetical protein